MAAAHAAAATAGEPLYRYLGGPDAYMLPLPQIQILAVARMPGGAWTSRTSSSPAPRPRISRGAGLDGGGVPRGRRIDGGSRHRCRAWRMKAAGGRHSPPTSRRWRHWCGRSNAPAIRRASAGGDRARRCRLGIRPRRKIQAGAGGQGTRQRRHGQAVDAAGSAAIRSCRSRTRWRRTTMRASPRSPARWAIACRWWATISGQPGLAGARSGIAWRVRMRCC